MRVTFYSTNILYKYICIFTYKFIKNKQDINIEYLYDLSLPMWDYIDNKDRKKIKMIALGVGKYHFEYKNKKFTITIQQYTNPILANKEGELTNEVILETDDELILYEYIDDAREKIQDEISLLGKNNKHTIRKYIFEFEGHCGDWSILNVCKKRNISTLFLEKQIVSNILKEVTEFTSDETKKEYEKYGIPYKYNILLYGIPGSGKTTTIHCIASMLNSDIGILQITRDVNDIILTKAINNLTRLDNCRILVLEDIDSLFSDERKAHDSTKNNITMSGLLNVLDGLMRNEGIIVFITTNNKEVLDEAVFRTGRIDLQYKYDFCKKEQIEQMISYYFPTYVEALSSFYDKIEHMELTIADLQVYFFKHRKNPLDILKNVKDILSYKENKQNHLYT